MTIVRFYSLYFNNFKEEDFKKFDPLYPAIKFMALFNLSSVYILLIPLKRDSVIVCLIFLIFFWYIDVCGLVHHRLLVLAYIVVWKQCIHLLCKDAGRWWWDMAPFHGAWHFLQMIHKMLVIWRIMTSKDGGKINSLIFK